MKRARSTTIRLLLLVSGCALGLVGAEIALRLVERGPDMGTDAPFTDRYDLGRLGYNEGVVPARKPPEEYRILSFGDSFTFAIVPNEASWNGVLARRLTEVVDVPFRVVNLGVRARSFPTYVAQWRYWRERLEHDAVLFDVYLGNDLADLHAYRHVYGVLAPPAGEAAAGLSSPDVYLRTDTWVEAPGPWRLRLASAVSAAVLRWSHRLPGAEGYLDTTQMPFPRYVAAMGAAAHPYRDTRDARAFTRDGWVAAADLIVAGAEAMAEGRRVAVMLAPPALFFQPDTERALAALGIAAEALDRGRPGALMRALAASLGAPELAIVDLLPCLEAAHGSGDLYLGTNSHWTFAGNRVAGECVAEALVEAWSLAPAAQGVTRAAGRPPSSDRAREYEAVVREAHAILADRAVRDAHLDLLRPLAANRYADDASLERAFEAAGLRRDPEAVRGSLDGITRAGSSPNASPAEAWGWAVASDLPAARTSVWVVADGRFIGFARTAGRREDVSDALGLPGEAGDFVSFVVPLREGCAALADTARIRAYAVSDDGRYAPLPLAGPRACSVGIER